MIDLFISCNIMTAFSTCCPDREKEIPLKRFRQLDLMELGETGTVYLDFRPDDILPKRIPGGAARNDGWEECSVSSPCPDFDPSHVPTLFTASTRQCDELAYLESIYTSLTSILLPTRNARLCACGAHLPPEPPYRDVFGGALSGLRELEINKILEIVAHNRKKCPFGRCLPWTQAKRVSEALIEFRVTARQQLGLSIACTHDGRLSMKKSAIRI